ncbi:KGG domain-containing protein [Chitinimonas koreensis]|uniref:KGG domain-containing protein n=1 Tax=Chitinimonas koreensis TaxID=356302 RepID=UPI000418DBBE|nr:KGG domain-containing protein [Chitinimonas koreensis]QNM97952.1 stress-induced protein [Chitinimonas koreensis]
MATRKPGDDNRSRRGFASMDPERQREIASKGGQAAHERGTAHEFDSAEARAAGRKGGEAVSGDRAHMAEIGRKGGENSHGGRRGAAAAAGSEAGGSSAQATSPRGKQGHG